MAVQGRSGTSVCNTERSSTSRMRRCWLQTALHLLQRVRTCLPHWKLPNIFEANGVLFVGGKAANAGGVATSALEMSQNSMRYFPGHSRKLTLNSKDIMVNIFHNIDNVAKRIRCREITTLRVLTSQASRKSLMLCLLMVLDNKSKKIRS